MYLGSRLHTVISQIISAASFDALRQGLADGAKEMGFQHVALVQHGGLPRIADRALVVTNYPRDFVQFYVESHQFVFDPVYEVSDRLGRPFTWDEIPNIIDLSERQIALFAEARKYGLNYGVTVPICLASEPSTSLTFTREIPIDLSPELASVLQIIAAFSFNAALRIISTDRRAGAPKLSRREAECTTLVALGKSDWEIGKILGLGPATVKYFVSAAKQRYGVHKRSELVARALMDAQLLDCAKAEEPSGAKSRKNSE